MNLSEMKQILRDEGLQLTKSLGQNFLHDSNQLRRIADLGHVQEGDSILEIGPGLGPLTEILLERGVSVLAIEKDPRLVEFLRKKFKNSSRLILEEGDALERVREGGDWQEWKVVSNLPYSVASPILVELALNPLAPLRVTVTLQNEVAERVVADHESDHYGIMSLLMQWRYLPDGMFKIPGSCFFPAPDVESATIALQRRDKPLLPESYRATFVRVVKRAFSQRRKMMFKLLKGDWSIQHLEQAFTETSLSPQIRGEAVPIEKLAALARILADLRGSIPQS
jgi:16S rRNA (adenine1518-N6/adenine1519-N6)-dimethyltransferase